MSLFKEAINLKLSTLDLLLTMNKFKNVFIKIPRLISAFSIILNPKTWRVFTHVSEVSRFDAQFLISWSQGGEDLALLQVLGNSVGKYIDVGAHHPTRFSVTRHLYQNGWTGVNVEANSILIPKFNRERNKDINLWGAVGSEPSYSLSIFEEPAISTIEKTWEKRFLSEKHKLIRQEEVPGITLRKILDEYFQDIRCNLLNIDIEGADFNALKTIGFQNLEKTRYPDWILVESTPPVSSSLKQESVNYLVENGYTPFLVLPRATLLKNTIETTI